MGLGGKTLAETSNINVVGLNKWKTLMQNTSLHI